MMGYELINLADLRLDSQNPRHSIEHGQREIIAALLLEESDKLVRLGKDIVEFGVSPMDALLVLKAGGMYTVLEGNRRTAALKLLINPGLAAGHPAEKQFQELSSKATELPTVVRCAVIGSREDARHWQELRHNGESGGAGVVGWGAEASQRFFQRRGGHADRAIIFADAVSQAYPSNDKIRTSLAEVRKQRLTTLGRLISDPEVRSRLGVYFEGDKLRAHYPPEALQTSFERILSDLADKLTVSALKDKGQRLQYMQDIRDAMPDARKYRAEAEPLVPTGRPMPKQSSRRKAPLETPKRLFDGVVLSNFSPRVGAILSELTRLDIDRFPNAAAVLIRAVVELTVDEVHEKKKWSLDQKFSKRLAKCLTAVDPSGKALKYQPVRTGLTDGTSMFAVSTLHAYVHNPHFNPTPGELRTIAARYTAFIEALDALATVP